MNGRDDGQRARRRPPTVSSPLKRAGGYFYRKRGRCRLSSFGRGAVESGRAWRCYSRVPRGAPKQAPLPAPVVRSLQRSIRKNQRHVDRPL